MYVPRVTGLLLLSFSACARLESSPTGEGSFAIVGGVDDPGDPAVVELFVAGVGECTAALVSSRVAVTAAHCITDTDPDDTFAIFTGWDDSKPRDGELVEATSVHVHPSYDPEDDSADIAVVILSRPLAIAPIPFNHRPLTRELIGQPVRMVGYGDNTVAAPTAGFGKKRQATSPLISFDGDWVYVGDAENNQCYGDSGGPALMTIGGVESIVGVDSFSESDDCNVLNGNTRMDSFASFVDMFVNTDEEPPPDSDGGTEPDPDDGSVDQDDSEPSAEPATVSEANAGCHYANGATPAGSGGLFAMLACIVVLRQRRNRARTRLAARTSIRSRA